MDRIPHLSLPLRAGPTGYEWVQQDTLDELTTCVQCIVSFPQSYRVEAPEFGIPDYELADRPLPAEQLEQIVETWENRAGLVVTEADYDPADPLAGQLQIEVTMPGEEE